MSGAGDVGVIQSIGAEDIGGCRARCSWIKSDAWFTIPDQSLESTAEGSSTGDSSDTGASLASANVAFASAEIAAAASTSV